MKPKENMDEQQYNEIPWELLGDALTGNLSPESAVLWQRWLSETPEHEQFFLRMQERWKNGMEDYRYYRMADVDASWKNLHHRMKKAAETKIERVVQGPHNRKAPWPRRILAVAAALAGIMVLIWFSTVKSQPRLIQTAENKQTVTLSDGTAITLHPHSQIEVPKGYGKPGRTVRMTSGEAEFTVVHHEDHPFTVELESSRIADIGTRFIVRKEEGTVHLAVSEGRVAFTRTTDGKGHEIGAGSAISLDTRTGTFGPRLPAESSRATESMLVFNGTPLAEVVAALHTVYGKEVSLDPDIAGRKLTAKLYGMPFAQALKVICSSMALDSATRNGIVVLKQRLVEQP
jgi:ferric-dicitrate binding protein FerR (iron transport regulator)